MGCGFKKMEQVIIVGAGPAGIATAACLSLEKIPYIILERSDCIASLWKRKTYDRLRLHTPKECCHLPHMRYPHGHHPIFLTRQHFLDYLNSYVAHFGIRPRFNEPVLSAWFDPGIDAWRVETGVAGYTAKWLVVASGENAEPVLPFFNGADGYKGRIFHSSRYRNGVDFVGKKVLVVGCGNSGMEIALDLHNSGAKPSIVIRSPFHVLPREMLGKSTFSVVACLTRCLPVWLVDRILVLYTRLVLGDTTSCLGVKRPKVGPLELKLKMGKTPVLDVGALSKIRTKQIKVRTAVESLTCYGAKFVDGSTENFDAVVLATGYKSNVPTWLHDNGEFFTLDGRPREKNWKLGCQGLYVVGLSGNGLVGASVEAQNIAKDITQVYWNRISEGGKKKLPSF